MKTEQQLFQWEIPNRMIPENGKLKTEKLWFLVLKKKKMQKQTKLLMRQMKEMKLLTNLLIRQAKVMRLGFLNIMMMIL